MALHEAFKLKFRCKWNCSNWKNTSSVGHFPMTYLHMYVFYYLAWYQFVSNWFDPLSSSTKCHPVLLKASPWVLWWMDVRSYSWSNNISQVQVTTISQCVMNRPINAINKPSPLRPSHNDLISPKVLISFSGITLVYAFEWHFPQLHLMLVCCFNRTMPH